MDTRSALFLFLRYLSLLVLGIFSSFFYTVFSPLTIYPVFGFLYLLDTNANLLAAQLIFFKGNYASIIPACIAGAAYYLLLILNLSTSMNTKKRIYSIVFLLSSFLALNIIRIIFFLLLLSSGFAYFDVTHKIVWYFGSTLMVVIIWFLNAWLFKIHSIPVYTDIKKITKEIFS